LKLNPIHCRHNLLPPAPPRTHMQGWTRNGDQSSVMLKISANHQNYWGGGPFANGCTALPDLWSSGLSDQLFLWLHVQHLNPTNNRDVYACPPRPYYVLAALRLAKLIESLRTKQADVPITIVCHSQGNMVGMAAAFIGDELADVTDKKGKSGRCVADTYVLCNPPFSLVGKNATQGWAERDMKDAQGNGGRQSLSARNRTLAAFFDILRKQVPKEQPVQSIDEFMKNEAHGFDAQSDRNKYGYGLKPSTYGRVTLYFNPHDQVISASTVQGIGWRGLSQQEIDATNGSGTFCQRVFSQNFLVGLQGQYDFWENQYGKPKRGSQAFWSPESPKARYSISKGLDANTSFVGKIWTVITAPVMIVATGVTSIRINALPPDDWTVPLTAPILPEAFLPEGLRLGESSKNFDQGFDAPGEYRNKDREYNDGDPYKDEQTVSAGETAGAEAKPGGAAKGDKESEASLRYEHHAMLRMKARREGLYKKDAKVDEEDKPDSASEDYKAWRSKHIKSNLAANINAHATDHSTIMTNGMHAQKALAYDVAIGCCHIKKEDLHTLRIAADWRHLTFLDKGDANKPFMEYFLYGYFNETSVDIWAKSNDGGGKMPSKIANQREMFFSSKGDKA
ncbi:T6SS effector phospholipase Tle3 domain-containing protein, partial [Massilia genomosp. 1]